MASCDTPSEHEEAKKLGWRTFLTMLPEDKRPKGVASCPASKEQGHKLTCEECLHCCGTWEHGNVRRVGDVGIIAHGPRMVRYGFWRQRDLELEEAA